MYKENEREFSEESIDFREYLDVILRRLWILIAVFITVVITNLVTTYRMVPIYQSASTLIIEQDAVRNENAFEAYYSFKLNYFTTQCDLILSEKVLQKAIQMMGEAGKGLSANALRGAVSVEPIKDTYLAKIKGTHTDPEKAALFANTLARAFVEFNNEDKRSSSRDAYTWMSEQLAIQKARVKQSEMELLQFNEKENIVSLEKRKSLIEENLSLIHRKYMEATLETSRLKTLIGEIRKIVKKPEFAESLPQVLQNPMIQNLKESLNSLDMELVSLSRTYKEKHPKVLNLKAGIRELKKRLETEISKVVKAIEIEYRLSETNEEAMKKNLDSLKRESMQIAQQAIQHGVLKREAETNQQMYGVLLGSLKKMDITGSMTPNNIRMVDEAKTPKSPVSPNKRKRIMMGILGGLALGAGLCFLVDYMDDTIKTEKELEYLGGELLGIVPKEKSPIPETGGLPEGMTLAYRNIKTILTFYRMDHVLKTLLVTSTTAQEGKSVTVAALGRLFAESGVNVLLIDIDFFRPRLPKFFPVETGTGISDFFLGKKEAVDVIQDTGTANLKIIPSGLIPPNPKDMLTPEKVLELISKVEKDFDLIIFDTPPLNAFVELAYLCSVVDGVAFAVKAGSTSRHTIRKLMKILTTAKANLLGYVLTHSAKNREKGYYSSYYDNKK